MIIQSIKYSNDDKFFNLKNLNSPEDLDFYNSYITASIQSNIISFSMDVFKKGIIANNTEHKYYHIKNHQITKENFIQIKNASFKYYDTTFKIIKKFHSHLTPVEITERLNVAKFHWGSIRRYFYDGNCFLTGGELESVFEVILSNHNEIGEANFIDSIFCFLKDTYPEKQIEKHPYMEYESDENGEGEYYEDDYYEKECETNNLNLVKKYRLLFIKKMFELKDKKEDKLDFFTFFLNNFTVKTQCCLFPEELQYVYDTYEQDLFVFYKGTYNPYTAVTSFFCEIIDEKWFTTLTNKLLKSRYEADIPASLIRYKNYPEVLKEQLQGKLLINKLINK